jgi:hypothetical protein
VVVAGRRRRSSASTAAASSRARSPARRCRCATSSRSTTAGAGPSRARPRTRFPPTIGELDLHLAGRGPPRGDLRAPRARTCRAARASRARVRGVGARRALGQRRRRLQLVGRPAAPDARARRLGIWELFVPRRRRRPATSSRSAPSRASCG